MNIFEIEVHPLADAWQMLPQEELEEMADGIKEGGLIHPLVVKDGVLIDGRNRLAACKIAGVEPETEELGDCDIMDYIKKSNAGRRHSSKGQVAMCLAMMEPDASKLKRRNSSSLIIKEQNAGYISQSRTILKHLPDKASAVRSGAISLSKAYQEAIEARDDAKSEEEKLHELRAVSPELAEDVIQGEKDIEEAIEEHEENKEKARVDRLGWWKILKDLDTNRMVLNDSSIEEIALAYSEYPKESGVDIVALAEWYGGIFESLLEKINENSSNS